MVGKQEVKNSGPECCATTAPRGRFPQQGNRYLSKSRSWTARPRPGVQYLDFTPTATPFVNDSQWDRPAF
jgi:hypothetical protein